MGTQLLPAIEATVRQKLRDEFEEGVELKWEPDELNVYIGECVRELSRMRPYIAKEVKTTIANSKVIDVSDIDGLLNGPRSITHAEYPTGQSDRKLRNIIVLDEEQIEIKVNRTPSAGGSGTLTGTVTFPSSGAAITGSGTDFDGELEAGYHIRKAVSGSSGRWYRVYSITDDTNLTLAEPVTSGDSGADTEDATEYCYETAYLFCEKMHTLNNETSTLTLIQEELLIPGACGKAAMAKAGDLINKANYGGPRTPDQMRAWGNDQYTIFLNGLRGMRRTRTSRIYPED